MRHADEFDGERTDRHAVARPDGDERAPFDAVLGQLRLDERERQRRAVDRAVDVGQDVRNGADVILVPVRQHERGGAPFLLQVREIGNDPIHAEQFGIGEHDAGVDDDRRLAPGERQHVHAELAESAERNDFEHPWNRERTHLVDDTPGGAISAKGTAKRGSIRLLGAPEIKRGGMNDCTG